ncbi:jg8715 [Pararge aegeria aegeria]|uniref:Jg8715 protein n=1 Tax=Pararge aegeria aegeria TaxID=348720 RepID=A0A8S4S6R2_9NEOP|nr:jg8715 [Pararge aegeria aegeria]
MIYGSETLSLTMQGLIRRLKDTKRAMERVLLRVCLRDQIRELGDPLKNQSERSSKSREAKVAEDIIPRRTDGLWGPKVLEWRPRNSKRSVGRSSKRWTEDIKRVAF